MDDLTSLRAIRRTSDGPTDAARDKARTALEARMAAPARGARFASLVARLRHPSPLVVTFGTIAAVAIVGIIVASVYAGGIRSAVQPAVPLPTATSTPTPTVGSQQVFGGDCSKLFTDAQVGDALGSPVKLGQDHSILNDGFDALPVIMRGGIECTWEAQLIPGNGADPTYLSVVVLPTSAKVADPYCYGTDKSPSCSFGSVASGLWMSGVAYGPKGSGTSTLIANIGTIESDFADAAADAGPVQVVTADGEWGTIDCAELDKTADLASVTGTPSLKAEDGNGAAEQPEGYTAAIYASGEKNCIWQGDWPVAKGQAYGFTVSFQPGGAFARTQIMDLPGAKEVSISGTDGAVRITPDGSVEYIVFSGSNALLISGQASDEQYFAAAAALVKALNG